MMSILCRLPSRFLRFLVTAYTQIAVSGADERLADDPREGISLSGCGNCIFGCGKSVTGNPLVGYA